MSAPAAAIARPRSRRGGTIGTIWRIAGPKRRALALGIVLRFVQSVFLAAPVAVLVDVIEQIRRSTLTAGHAWAVLAVYVTCLAGQLGFGYLSNRLCWICAYEMMGELRVALLDHLRRLPMSFHTNAQAGDVVTAFTADMATLENFTHHSLPVIVGAVGAPVIVAVALGFFDPALTAATLVSVAAGTPVFLWVNRVFGRLSARRQALQAEAAARIIEYVQGIAVVRAFGQAGARLELFRRSLDDFRRINTTMAVQIAPLAMVFITIVELGVPVVLLFGSYRLFGGSTDVGTLLVFLVLVLRVYQPLVTVATQAEMIRLAQTSLDRVMRIVDAEPAAEPEQPTVPRSYGVEFDHVSFSYLPDVQVLSDVSFSVPQGSLTAIVGPSGSGKTTVLNLLARFWDPAAGRILIDGVDVRDVGAETLFSTVSVVFQDVYLFQGSVFDNIAFGRANASREEVLAAARAAQAHDFITALPDGYDTMVGEGGATLSGGERQRVSIARAILKDAPIVLLDEATASIDPTNERLLQAALAQLVRNKTLVVVAHRLSTIRSADQILALDDGRIVERGTHEELLAREGLYARFWAERERASRWRVRRPSVPSPE